jgi:DNA-binding transcriptional LysR family regulator
VLDVRRLRALREVALKGSFSEAAAALNYTQSAISQQVAQLERQVGVVLIERRGRRIELTPAATSCTPT